MAETIEKIKADLIEKNDWAGGPEWEPEKLDICAKYVSMHRNDGISVETLCMMLTDAMTSAISARTRLAALERVVDKDAKWIQEAATDIWGREDEKDYSHDYTVSVIAAALAAALKEVPQ